MLEGRTAMVIAHRLATIRGADRIIVLQNGGIIETGTHDKLMVSGGLYSRLYRMNYASFDDPGRGNRRPPRRQRRNRLRAPHGWPGLW